MSVVYLSTQNVCLQRGERPEMGEQRGGIRMISLEGYEQSVVPRQHAAVQQIEIAFDKGGHVGHGDIDAEKHVGRVVVLHDAAAYISVGVAAERIT